jgi:hypothetical protein
MADYRFITYPMFTAKYKDFLILSLIAKKDFANIGSLCNVKPNKIADLRRDFEEGFTKLAAKKTTIKSLSSDKISAKDWANIYGLH